MTDPVSTVGLTGALTARGQAVGGAGGEAAIRAAAKEFEAVFLAEMLKHTGLGRPPESFGGGVGEAQFAPFLVREYASAIAERGGLGIAERIAAALIEEHGA